MPIRRITRDDKAQIIALDTLLFAVPPFQVWRENDFDLFFNEKSCYAFYDEKQPDIIIGYIFAIQGRDHTYISNIGSDHRSGKRGIGTALMELVMLQEAERAKKTNRPFVVNLDAEQTNASAIQFYKNLGFKETGLGHQGIRMVVKELPEKFKNKSFKALALQYGNALALRNVDTILEQFAIDIQSIGTFHLKAKHIAEELLKNLREYKNEAFKQDTRQALEIFAQRVEISIHAAAPELQNDLSWGTYLINLSKKILNAITTAIAWLVTFSASNHNGFFVLQPSDASRITSDLESSFKDSMANTF